LLKKVSDDALPKKSDDGEGKKGRTPGIVGKNMRIWTAKTTTVTPALRSFIKTVS